MKSLEVTAQSKASSNKPAYKEYQKFLQTYDNKSDRSTSPTTLSTNSSTSSVPSMISETDNVPVAFNEYLQNYGSKRFNAVKPILPKKNVKTEIFIQVNEDKDNDNFHGRKYNTLRTRKTPGKIILARQNSLNKCDTLKSPMLPAGHNVVLPPPLAKQTEVPDDMIYAKTAFLNELSNKPPRLHKSPSPTLTSSVKVIDSTNTTSFPIPPPPPAPPKFAIIESTNSSLPPPPPKLPDFTNKTPPISSTVKKVNPTSAPPKRVQNRPSFITEMQSKFNENRLQPTSVNQNGTAHGKRSPPNSRLSSPPKFLNPQSKSSDVGDHAVPKLPSFKNRENGITVTGKKSPPPSNSSIPPPPKFLSQVSKSSDIETPNTTTYVPVTDNNTNVDKSNPNVKKLVYNTYRGLLGAYNNKANNMVTMPKNTVVQDQGVAKQLESME